MTGKTAGRNRFALLIPAVALTAAAFAALAPAARSEAVEYLRDLRYLSSDQLKGRGNNQPEIDQAAAYIANRFAHCGLVPVGDDGTYFQHFEARTAVELGPENSLTISTPDQTVSLTIGSDYSPLYAGAAGSVTGKLAFAGFGITAPELQHDDYAGLDVDGKVVAVFQHEPEEYVADSRFAGASYSPYATLSSKAQNARRHGAAALLVLPDPRCRKERSWKHDVQVESLGIPVVKLSESWTRRLLALAPKNATPLAASKETTPARFLCRDSTVTVRVDAVEMHRILKNVVGLIPGATPEYIVIGAHYDHIGLGERKSLAPHEVPEVHNGADDNASGAAGLLQLAAQLSGPRPDRGVLCIAFAGEELGLLGSTEYTRHPSVPLSQSRAMINLDMIGRSTGEVFIGGVGTALEFRPLLDDLKQKSPLVFRYAETPQAASDHLSFTGEKIPVLFFFSGLHADYHRPSDDWDKIDVKRAGEILSVVRALVVELTRQSTSLRFVDMDPDPALLSGSLGTAIWGLETEFSWEGDGVLVSRVKTNSSAESAGFQKGDILVGCDGTAVFNRLDLIELLTRRGEGEPGNHRIAVLRGDSIQELCLGAGASGEGPAR